VRNAGLSRVAVAAVAAAALWFVVDAGAWSVYPAYLAALLAAVYGLALSSGVRPPRYSAGSGLLVAVLDSALISLLVASTGGWIRLSPRSTCWPRSQQEGGLALRCPRRSR